MRKVELREETGPIHTGTVKGLAAIAVRMKSLFLGDTPCPRPLGDFWEALQGNSGGRAFLNEFKGSLVARKEEIHQVHSLLRWVESGLPVFDLTHGFASALLLTDPADVSADLVHPPFDTFVVRFPDGFWHMEGSDGGQVSVAFAIVHAFDAVATGGLRARPMMSVRLVGRDGKTSTWEALEPPRAGEALEGWLDEPVPDPIADTVVGRGEFVAPTEHDRRLVVAFRRLYVNLCLYVAAHGRGEALGRRDAKGRPVSSSAEPQPDVWVLGREVKLARELVDAARAWTDAQSPRAGAREGWKLRERFTVRGHWRNQAHGPGRAERKLRWIAPYWKGEGPTFQHVYAPARNS